MFHFLPNFEYYGHLVQSSTLKTFFALLATIEANRYAVKTGQWLECTNRNISVKLDEIVSEWAHLVVRTTQCD